MEHLDENSTAYGMQISAEKTKLMTNNTNGISSNIRVNGKNLESVQSFKYLGAIVTDEGSMPEIRSRIAQTIAALTKLKIIWDDNNIDLNSKIRLLLSLVMSIFLYSCETWTFIIIISAVHATAGRWPPQLGCGVEPRNPPRWFRAAWWARQLSLRVDSLAMRQVVWGYILPIAGPKQNL